MTVFRLRDRAKFIVERWLQKGARFQLLFIAGVIATVAILGGLVVWIFSGRFDHPADAIWWGFLRLTDPGYLGDDEGALLRTVSTIITLLGYVLFLGSLVAILTQWLNETMRTLERGLTPIALRDHILILGWTNRTPTIVKELLMSEERVKRFLTLRKVKRLRVVILAEDVTAHVRMELREVLGRQWDDRRVILRSGTSLRLEHLRRVAYRDASVIIVPGSDFHQESALGTDARVIKTLISLSPHEPREQNRGASVVAEVFDAEKIPIAENAYRGGEIDVISSDAFIGRLIAQNVRHRGLSYIYSELLTHAHGNEIYARRFPELSGRRFGTLVGTFPNAVLLGVIRPENRSFVPYLNPDSDLTLEREDRLVFLARSYRDCEPGSGHVPSHDFDAAPAPLSSPIAGMRRILILGWSHKISALVREFDSYASEAYEITILSRIPPEVRQDLLDLAEGVSDKVSVRHIEGDYTLRGTLSGVDPGSYDNIVFLASESSQTGEESDARTILGYVLLRSLLHGTARQPDVVIELMDPANAHLFETRAGEVIISPLILSHILAHVSLRRELSVVFNELFGPGGAEFFFRPANEYGLSGRRVGMLDIQEAVRSRNEIPLGVRIERDADMRSGGVRLNPPQSARWTMAAEDEIVVLATA